MKVAVAVCGVRGVGLIVVVGERNVELYGSSCEADGNFEKSRRQGFDVEKLEVLVVDAELGISGADGSCGGGEFNFDFVITGFDFLKGG